VDIKILKSEKSFSKSSSSEKCTSTTIIIQNVIICILSIDNLSLNYGNLSVISFDTINIENQYLYKAVIELTRNSKMTLYIELLTTRWHYFISLIAD
jgi:hypothetical protein